MDLRVAVRNDRDIGYGGVVKVGAVKRGWRNEEQNLGNRFDVITALQALVERVRRGDLDYLWKED